MDDGKTCYYETRTVAPTVSLHFFAKHETGELHIFGTGEKQIALKAVAPDGTTLTSRFESSGPRLSHVVFDDPEDGAYEIWVGGCGYSSAPASIVLSEFPPSDSWVERGKRKRN